MTVTFIPGCAEITLSLLLQIVAVILSTTGIALLAYADGIATTKTLAGVVLAAASAAGSAVYKVFFKRVFGEVSFCQVAIFFSSIGLCSLLTLWTIFLALHLTGQGNFCWQKAHNTYIHLFSGKKIGSDPWVFVTFFPIYLF